MKMLKKISSLFLAGILTVSVAFSTPVVFADNSDSDNPVDFNWYTQIKDTIVSPIDTQIYTGKSIKPPVTVKYKNEILKQNKDYKLTYSNNKSIGKATVTINGINDYKGSKTVQFKISPQQVKGLKATPSTTGISLSWTKTSGISNYAVYRATSQNGAYTKIKSVSSNTSTYKNTSVSKTDVYYYKVRAYKTVNEVNYYGEYSDIVCSATTPSKPTLTIKNSGTKTVNTSWGKISGANGYEIYRRIGTSGQYSKVKTVTSGSTLSYTNKNLTKNKTYYYKVRAYKIINGQKLYSSFSTAKQIKCNK